MRFTLGTGSLQIFDLVFGILEVGFGQLELVLERGDFLLAFEEVLVELRNQPGPSKGAVQVCQNEVWCSIAILQPD